MFGKTDGGPEPSAAPERPGTSAPGSSPATAIGAKARFVGEMTGDEDILIHGRLEGNIKVNRKVTVAASGEVKGDIHGRSVVVGGRVQGQVRADERVELLASASVQGNVTAPKVVIAEGAQLQGNVAMSATASPAAPDQKKAEEH
jgi:cytoskeletal protein CcmA (bactofilin family)